MRERILRINADRYLSARSFPEFNWKPHPVKGVTMVYLSENYQSRQFSYLIRCQPQTYYPAHRHAGEEEILMLEGDLQIGDRAYQSGQYIFSAVDSYHEAGFTEQGCTFFVEGNLDDHYEWAWDTYRPWTALTYTIHQTWQKLLNRNP
jgi:anti-sigma factor ChrR (cupin superfamily)